MERINSIGKGNKPDETGNSNEEEGFLRTRNGGSNKLSDDRLQGTTSDSITSSSSEPSDDENDFLQLDANGFAQTDDTNNSCSLHSNSIGSGGDHELNHRDSSPRTETSPKTSSVGNVGYAELATQAPSSQAMSKTETTENYRIPPYVFERTKSQTPAEWSMASNESLFSIHPGNSSFSRDHLFLLDKLEELDGFPSSPTIGHTIVEGQEAVEDSDDLHAGLKLGTDGVRRLHENGYHEEEKSHVPEDVPHLRSASHRSDLSAASTKSFAFPILAAGSNGSPAKAEPEPPPTQPQPSSNNSTSWSPFSCCSCFFASS